MKKSFVIKQHDLTDCGPACLLSIISYYGGYVPIEMLRINAYTNKTGTSAYNLINCAKKFGLSGSGIKVENILSLGNDKLPCIAHLSLKNGLNHYVVIYKMNKSYIILMDPKKGKTKLSITSFNEVFSGVIILLQPYTQLKKINKPNSVKKLIIKTILDNKVKTVMLFLLSILLIVVSIFLSYFLKIGQLIINKKVEIRFLLFFLVLYLILYFIKNLFDLIKNVLIINFNKNVSLKLLGNFSKTIFNLPLNFIKSRTSGEVISRFNELLEINNILPNLILSIFLDLIMSFITLIFLFSISYKLSLVGVIFMIVYFIIGYTFKNPTINKINKNLDKNADFNSSVIESINNLRSIKYLNNENNMRERLGRYCRNSINNNCHLNSFYNITNFIKNMIYDFMILFISSLGLYYVYLNRLDVVDLFTFLIIINYFTEPIKDLVDMITKLCFIKTSITKINEFSVSCEEESGVDFIPGDIKISNLSYAYNGIDYILKNYSCVIKNKSKVLLQGVSGSGKSTLCQLISKQLNNYDGNIFINNHELNDISSKSLRKNVTYIGQKDSLITDTIKNNIKYERNVKDKELNTICKICEIDKIVQNRFNHLDSFISESSDNISGGEKQRIALARGLIQCGNILILDESLSEVNKDMEERILKRIFKYFQNKTIIYVSHKNYKNIFDATIKV